MLFKLSLGNIRKSMRDYAIYFFTLMMGVAIFYVFNSMDSQTAFLQMSQSTKEIIQLLINMLSGVSVFVAFVLGFLIVYASRFLMKRRNKEFAVYLMLGMGKGRISVIILIETILIGLISLAAGLGIGILSSQLMSAFTANLFEADMTDYRFIISGSAILKTIIYFGIMYLAVMIFNGFMVGKCKLIDLIQSGRKSEKLKLKNPVLCVIIFIIAVCGLGYAYYNVGWNTDNMTNTRMNVMIVIGTIATFLIFWSVSGMLLKIIMSMKNTYFRSLNCFTFRQLSSKINTMVISMSVICLMLFVTICTLISGFSMRNSMNSNLQTLCPADIELTTQSNGKAVDTIKYLNDCDSSFMDYIGEYVQFDRYECEGFTMAAFLNEHIDEILAQYKYLAVDTDMEIYKLSDYNALMKLYGRETISLEDDEYTIICNYDNSLNIYNMILNDNHSIEIFGNSLKPRYTECQDGFIHLSSQPINSGFFVVPDNAVDENCKSLNILIGQYKAEDKTGKAETEKILMGILENIDSEKKDTLSGTTNPSADDITYEADDTVYCYSNTRIDITESSVGLGALAIFIGLYLGIVFLISSGAILALKSLSDNVDSIPRYAMLRKIGAEENSISKSLLCQTGLFFLIPLLLACIHSYFGMRFAMYYVLRIFGTDGMAKSIASTGIIILLIYGGYFLITYLCGKSIIKEKK